MDADLTPLSALDQSSPLFSTSAPAPVEAPVRYQRPANLARSAFHALTGVFALALIQAVSHRTLCRIAVASAIGCWFLELTRQRIPAINRLCMAVLGRFAHPHERHQVNSSTWYATALALMALFFPAHADSVGVIVLGFGDPVAALIGRRFGRIKLASGRSLEGSLAFVVAAGVAAFMALRVCYPAESMVLQLSVAMAAAVAGAVAELVSPVDDNFSIPVTSAFAALLVALL